MLQYKHIERLVYVTPGGIVYPLHAPPRRVVLSEDGFGTPPMEYVTDRAPFQHGDTVRAVHLLPRPIQLVVLHNFCSREEYWNGRTELLNAIKPQISTTPPPAGKLLYYLPGRKRRQIDVLLESGPGFAPPEPGWRARSFTEALRFVAHDPMWYDPTLQSQSFAFVDIADQLVFPITFPIVFEAAAFLQSITYTGTSVVYPTIVVTGPVTGVSITNQTTGDKIALTQDILAGQYVTITLSGIKSVVRNDGLNMIGALSSDSDLTTFGFVPDPTAPGGVNILQISGTGTSPASRVEFQYYERFFGV